MSVYANRTALRAAVEFAPMTSRVPHQVGADVNDLLLGRRREARP
jgi:hypothetical protein